jgi:hypothetical protein
MSKNRLLTVLMSMRTLNSSLSALPCPNPVMLFIIPNYNLTVALTFCPSLRRLTAFDAEAASFLQSPALATATQPSDVIPFLLSAKPWRR